MLTEVRLRKLRRTETIVFFAGWTGIMLLGADFPPPAGFVWVVIGIAAVDGIQCFYLGWLLRKIGREPTFLRTLILYTGIGFAAALVSSYAGGSLTEYPAESLVWIVAATAAAAIYGILFWALNRLIVNRKKRKPE